MGKLDRDGRLSLLLGDGMFLGFSLKSYWSQHVLPNRNRLSAGSLFGVTQMKVVLTTDVGRLALALVMYLQMMQ